jgi:hypothetical protein
VVIGGEKELGYEAGRLESEDHKEWIGRRCGQGPAEKQTDCGCEAASADADADADADAVAVAVAVTVVQDDRRARDGREDDTLLAFVLVYLYSTSTVEYHDRGHSCCSEQLMSRSAIHSSPCGLPLGRIR